MHPIKHYTIPDILKRDQEIENMITKTIHYCWFGRNPKPKLTEKCIKSWKKYCPDYEIIEWNEDNYDIASAPLFVRQAYEAKKWGFVPDYIRMDIVNRYGGIYLDTDVELLGRPDRFLDDRAFFGLESDQYVALGLGFGAEKGTPILSELMEEYTVDPFILPDGSPDLTTAPVRNTKIFLRHGFVQDGSEQILDGGVHIYPKSVFNPWNLELSRFEKTADTASIHWYAGSWCPEEEQNYIQKKLAKKRKASIKRFCQAVLGKRLTSVLGRWIRFLKQRL